MALLRPAVWRQQPQQAADIDWSNPLAQDLEYVLLGSQRFYNPTKRQITRVIVNPDIATYAGIGTSIQETEYETYPVPVASGGTTNWTIAGLFIPITLSGSAANADGNAVAGYCEEPGTAAAWDRTLCLQNTTQAWRGYLYDGAVKLATSTATAAVGKLDRVVVTCNGSELICAVYGAPDASVAVSSNGYNGYSSAEFCVGNPVGAGGILQTAVPLLIKTNRYWSPAMRRDFFNNPWQIFKPIQRRLMVLPGAGGGAVSLTITGATHSHAADSLILSSQSLLSVADASHAHVADGVTLTTQWLLTIAESAHAHTAENLTLDPSNATPLTAQDATHAHAADSLGLTLNTWLAIVDAAHAHTADAPTLTAEVSLAIAEALHSHAADNLVLSEGGAAPFTQDQLAYMLAYIQENLMIWNEPIENGVTAAQMMRIMAAALAGTSTKAGNTITFKGIDGTTDRIVGSFDSENNRTGAVLDGS